MLKFLISTRFTAVLLFAFAFLIGWATFIEDKYDTITAKVLIFNSFWLELIMVLLVVNFIGNIKRYSMLQQKKWTSLSFHLAFVVIIIGAGVTRYTGYEGMMPIREGETTDVMYSSEPYLQIAIVDPSKDPSDETSRYGYNEPLLMTMWGSNDFTIPFPFEGHEVSISFKDFKKQAGYKLEENVEGGVDILEVVTSSGGGRQSTYIESGKAERVGNVLVSFNNPKLEGAIHIFQTDSGLAITSPFFIERLRMADQMADSVQIGETKPTFFAQAHQVKGTMFVLKQVLSNAKKVIDEVLPKDSRGDVLITSVKVDGEETDVALFGGAEKTSQYEFFHFEGFNFRMAYGSKPIQLPFSIGLNDFVLERYPGSMSPSSFKSEVMLYDEERGISEPHSIFMNNVLDYRGYRFFQSSYDQDELGTILSVNHDAAGTWITYVGYLLLGLGFFLTLINKHSRFRELMRKILSNRAKRMGLPLVFLLLLTQVSKGQEVQVNHISEEHAQVFGKMLVQSQGGRFQPMSSLAFDFIRKIYKKEKYVDASGEVYSPERLTLDVFVNTHYWKDQPIIKITDAPIAEFIGIEGKYAAFTDFFDKEGNYKLKEELAEAHRKSAGAQNKFDKALIKADEKVNIVYMLMQGRMFRLFPTGDAAQNHKWISWFEKGAEKRLLGEITIDGKTFDLSSDTISSISLLDNYLQLLRAPQPDYVTAEGFLKFISALQIRDTPEEFMPSEGKIALESAYNKISIFDNLQRTYSILAIFLLLFTLIDALVTKRGQVFKYLVTYPMWLFIGVLALAFVAHTIGLGVRWYLSGHAPWSDGYEALIFIAWGTLLSGFIFSRFSKITLAATAFVAFLIIMTAGHSNYDPQLTNLVPVLKSYWLVIHVAVITTSYGFLALGCILAIISLFILLFKSKRSAKKTDMLVEELTWINEMTLTIGVFLAAVGTFLGGVWANESWGRYWGWDAKETWALVIVLVYAVILHFRFIPGLRGKYAFNVASLFGFSSVLMTFFGVNYYFSKGLHSYARGEAPAFPMWIWYTVFAFVVLAVVVGLKERKLKQQDQKD